MGGGWGRGGRLFEAGRLLTFSSFRMGAYSRWALIRGWALIRINTVVKYLTNKEALGAFHLVKISGISGYVVNGTRFVGSSHWKIPRKVENLKRWARFPGWNFRRECRVPFTFLVVCTKSRSTVGHGDVPMFATKWNNVLPIGNSTFAPTEISSFFSQMESAPSLYSVLL